MIHATIVHIQRWYPMHGVHVISSRQGRLPGQCTAATSYKLAMRPSCIW